MNLLIILLSVWFTLVFSFLLLIILALLRIERRLEPSNNSWRTVKYNYTIPAKAEPWVPEMPDNDEPYEISDEKSARVYYQGIVYDVCNKLDLINGGKIVCGTFRHPSESVQMAMSLIKTRLYETDIDNDREAATIDNLVWVLEPLIAIGGGWDMPAFHDLTDDVIVYSNSGKHITVADIRRARTIVHNYKQRKAADA